MYRQAGFRQKERSFGMVEQPGTGVKRQHSVGLLVLSLLTFLSTVPAFAREQWQMQHPQGPAPTGPIDPGSLMNAIYDPTKNTAPSSFAPGLVAAPNASVPGLATPQNGSNARSNSRMPAPDIIQQIIATRLPAGTVLTGILADDLSSNKSLPQDLFSIVLPDGYFANGVEVIPPNARIVGTVVSVSPSKSMRGVGTPGNLQVGLTTLIFPDGRSCKFSGFIDRNPAHDLLTPPPVRTSSMNFADYKRDVSSFFGSFTSGLGAMRRITDRGPDFSLKAGTMVPVKLSAGLDISRMTAPTVASPLNGAGGNLPPATPGNVNNGGVMSSGLVNPFAAGAANRPPGSTGEHDAIPSILPVDLPDPF